MNPRLQILFLGLESQRQQLMDQVLKLTPEQYHRGIGEKWSVSQILTHILISEKLSLGYMRKKSLGMNSLEETGWTEELKMTLLKISQRIPLRYSAPGIVLMNTPSPLPANDLDDQWHLLRQELKAFLEKTEEKNLYKKIYKHPVAGRLNIIHAITFFREHITHHLPQIRRLL
jgi:hypothetical protein